MTASTADEGPATSDAGPPRLSDARFLAVLVVATVALRWALAAPTEVVGLDEALMHGHGSSWLRTGRYEGIQWPVTYPLLSASLARVVGGRLAVDLIFVAGALALVPLFHAVRALLGREAARWGALLAALLPATSAVVSKSGSHPVYLVVLAAAFLLHVRFALAGRWRDAATLGLVLGLAYVTRTDGFVYLLVVGASFLLLRPPSQALAAGGGRWSWRIRSMALVAAGAALPVLANVAHVHSHTGRWQLSAHVEFLLKRSPVVGADAADVVDAADAPSGETGALGAVRGHPAYFASKVAYNARTFLRTLGDMTVFPAVLFVLLGLALPRLVGEADRAGVLLVAWTVPPLAFLVLHVEPRYFSPMAMFLAAFAGEGAARLRDLLRPAPRWVAPAVAATVAAFLITLSTMHVVMLRRIEEPRVDEKAAAVADAQGDRLARTFVLNPQVRFALDAPRGRPDSAPVAMACCSPWTIVDPADSDIHERAALRALAGPEARFTVVPLPEGLELHARIDDGGDP